MKDAIDMRTDLLKDGNPSVVADAPGRSRLSFLLWIFPLLFLSLTGSCIRDDLSDCVEETTLTVLFEYLMPDDSERFLSYIGNVDLYIFDENKNLYMQIPADKNSLENFQGVKVDIDPGEYYLVAWGNTLASASAPSGDSYDGMILRHDATAATTGPLYYGPDLRSLPDGEHPDQPYRVTVIKNENNVHTLPFMGAHHTVEIYIKGMTGKAAPRAILDNIPSGYEYSLSLISSNPIRFVAGTEEITVEDQPMLFASFCIPQLDHSIPVTAAVSDTQAIRSVSVQQYVEDNDLDITDGNPGVIPILFEYRDGTFVQVTFPSWIGNDVVGGF